MITKAVDLCDSIKGLVADIKGMVQTMPNLNQVESFDLAMELMALYRHNYELCQRITNQRAELQATK